MLERHLVTNAENVDILVINAQSINVHTESTM